MNPVATQALGLERPRRAAHRRGLDAPPTPEEVARRLNGEKWHAFRDRYGDWSRDLVLWASRRYGGMRPRKLGQQAGGMDYMAVAPAVRRLGGRAAQDRRLRRAMKRISQQCQL